MKPFVLTFKTKDLSPHFQHNLEIPTDPHQALVADFLCFELSDQPGVIAFRQRLAEIMAGNGRPLSGQYGDNYAVYANSKDKNTTIAKLFAQPPPDDVVTDVSLPTTALLTLVEQWLQYIEQHTCRAK
jgi:hypothetical protein